jgi:tetratricopeptide (TPR) repeat protein
MSDAGAVLGLICLFVSLTLLWLARRQLPAMYGLVWFGLALAPTIQVMPHHLDRADRFLYLPLVGLVLATATLLRSCLDAPAMRRAISFGAAAMGLLVLAAISGRQLQTWRNNLTVWENCLRLEPKNPQVYCGYADSLAKRREWRRAIDQYEKAISLEPGCTEAMVGLGRLLSTCPDARYRDEDLAVQLTFQAFQLNPAAMGVFAAAMGSRGDALLKDGRYPEAIDSYRRSLAIWPRDEQVTLALARVLAACPQESLRNSDEAVQFAERACRWQRRQNPRGLSVLAETYAGAGRFGDALAAVDEALGLTENSGDAQLVAELQHARTRYQTKTLPLRNP